MATQLHVGSRALSSVGDVVGSSKGCRRVRQAPFRRLMEKECFLDPIDQDLVYTCSGLRSCPGGHPGDELTSYTVVQDVVGHGQGVHNGSISRGIGTLIGSQ